ncbi:DUF2637 domain-containing protein [Spongiactinospora sp. 9N601]|uniref:DUF2637 domain-containing protein n=1 Tax=Spongiactinospora sp. 9N601 TaxID=3375149 RepID=UPI0037A7E596
MGELRTYYDPRAARAVAGAEAEAVRAETDARRARIGLEIERERLALAAERDRMADERRAERAWERAQARTERARERAQARAARRQALRAAAAATATAVRARVPAVVGAVAIGSPMTIAWSGQLAFGSEVMGLGGLAWTLPVALEGAVLYSAYLGDRAISAGLPAGRYRAMTWTMMGVAAAMNAWHQIDARATADDPWAGVQVGLVYAIASVVGIVLWELTAGLRKQAKSGRSGSEIRAAAWRRLRYPRLSWQAASIRAARGPACTAEQAWAAAWSDRYGAGPDASRRDRRLTRRIIARQARADRAAARRGELGMVGGLVIGRPLPPVRPPVPAAARLAAAVVTVEPVRESAGESAGESGDARTLPVGESRPTLALPPGRESGPESGPESGGESAGRPPRESGRRSGGSARAAAGPGRASGGRSAVNGRIAPRKTIDEHRATLAEAIESGRLSGRESAETIRDTLGCAQATARTLAAELKAGGVS